MTITAEQFFKNNQMKIDIFNSKYTREGETVDQCFRRISSIISSADYKDEADKKYWEDRWIEELLADKWRPGGSIIAGTKSEDRKISLFNCTTIPIENDTLEDISRGRYECQKVAAHRQGVGVDFSNLRPLGSKISNAAEVSEGVISWMKSYDNISEEVGQKGRKPAMLFSLKVSHPDIIDFISCKDDLDSINNANISVQITDRFMEAVKNDLDWEMTFETNHETTTKTIKAKKLLNMIADHSHKAAEPGLQFIDKMKEYSIIEALGYDIISSNACSEAPLPAHGVCCLSSINMGKVPTVKDVTFHTYMEDLTTSLVRFMDNVNEYEIKNKFKSPLEGQHETVAQLRQIGLGITNLHQWLYNQGLGYDSDEGIAATEEFFKWYFYYTFKASAMLAKERGACPAWDDMFYASDRNWLKENITPFLSDIFKELPDLAELYYETGIRNASLLSIAPTGTLSLTFQEDVLSTGIEPLIGMAYWQKTRAVSKGNHYDYYFKVPDTIMTLALSAIEDKGSDDYKKLSEFTGGVLDKDGSVGESIISLIEKYLPKHLLKAAHDIDPFKKVELMSRVQKYVDACISVTFNLPEDFPVADVERLYIEAYNKNLKALSIYRDGCREGILIFDFPKTAKEKEIHISEIDKKRPEEIIFHHAPKRPKGLPCEIFNVLKHKVLVGLFDDKPYETFIVDTNVKLPSNGMIVRHKKGRYTLEDISGNVLIDNLSDRELINEEIKRLTRMVSMGLRHGVPLEFLIRQISTFSSDDRYPKALGNVLKKYNRLMLDAISDDKKCDVCGEILVKHGGCMVCVSCNSGMCEA
jgi:ribonucleoside-diphosphate reductase alpha chain